MSFQEIALHLWPMWLMGIVMMFVVFKSEHRDLLRITPKSVLKFTAFMAAVTSIRIGIFLLSKWAGLDMSGIAESVESVKSIPWQAVFGVFWEDMLHGLPLVLLARMLPTKWWSKVLTLSATAMVMLSFGSGHVYQGMFAAIVTMAYIPVSIKYGKKYGFGTVMLCHILYDLITIFSIKWMLGQI